MISKSQNFSHGFNSFSLVATSYKKKNMGSKNKLKKLRTKTKPDEFDNNLFGSDDTFAVLLKEIS